MTLRSAAAAPLSPDASGGHRTAPSALGWSYWRDVECRSAGFPMSLALAWGQAEVAAAADALDQAEKAFVAARRAAIETLKQRIETLRALPPDDSCRWRDVQDALRKAYRTRDNALLLPWLEAEHACTLTMVSDRLQSARKDFDRAYLQACSNQRELARDVLSLDRFKEAVAWQNLAALRQSFARLSDDAVGSDVKRRNAELLVAAYVQRYSMKNDTIGFFGPEGWARFVDEPGHLSYEEGPELIEARQVYFEDWAIRTLAECLGLDRRLRPWQTPRLAPHLRWDGKRLHLPGGSAVAANERDVAVLCLCDGTALAGHIAEALCADPFGAFDTPTDVYDCLDALVLDGRVVWGFNVAVGDAHPERSLRRQLEQIDDASLRCEAIDRLDALERGRAALVASAGSADAVASALEHLNEVFRQVTQREASRAHGQTYGARAIVYEDCRRKLRVSLGRDFQQRLQAPLDLVLASARWYCHRLARQMRIALMEAFERNGGGRPLGFLAFWYDVQPLFQGEGMDVRALQEALMDRWEEILQADQHAPQNWAPADIAQAVQTHFSAPDSGWRSACHQSPDVMVAASGPAAAQRGDLLFVLGELHMGLNTLINHSAYHQHQQPEALLAALRADLGAPRFIPLFSREGSLQPIRVQVVTEPGVDRELRFAHDACPLDPATAIAVGDLIVERRGDGLVVCSNDGQLQADVLDVLGESMSAFAVNRFRMIRPRAHQQRLSIGDLVIQRECWQVELDALAPACEGTDQEAYRFLRDWRAATGLPERVFVKAPWETKPFYVDFTSPTIARMLVRHLRSAAAQRGAHAVARLSFSEMLPEADMLWLRDSQGSAYTSELRMVAVNESDVAGPGRSA
jgi:hypothetical protein